MKLWSLSFLLLVAMIGASALPTQLGMIGKSVLGEAGLATLEVTQPDYTSYNPAAIALAYDGKVYTQGGYEVINFDNGPTVKRDSEIVVFEPFKGKGYIVRLARYGIDSNVENMGHHYGLEFDGQSYEVSLAKALNDKVALGVTWIPYEKITTEIYRHDNLFVKDTAKCGNEIIAGLTWKPIDKLTLGATYDYGRTTSDFVLGPDSPHPHFDSDKFKTRLMTYGASYQILENTTVSANFQRGHTSGPGYYDKVKLDRYAVTQKIGRASVTVDYFDHAWGASAQYTTKKGMTIGASYAPDTLRASEDVLGRAKICSVWLGKTW